jgi:N-formylglutamate amidohydrolase
MSERKPFLGSEFVSKSGGNLPGSSDAAYTLYTPKKLTSPVIVAVPHAGRAYPSDVAAKMREPQWSKLRLEDRCADLLGYGVAQATGTALLVAHAPRALIDLNRSPDDVDWGMISGAGVRRAANSHANRRARGGLGLVPRRLPGLGEIWREPLTCESLDARIDGVHRPYHTQLGRMMERLRDEWGASL